MNERLERGVLDTSAIIDFELLPQEALPIRGAVTTVTLAELEGGLHDDRSDRAGARLMRRQVVEANFNALPFDADAGRRYGQLVALVIAAGQRPRLRRMDMMIAATALARALPLYTRNAADFPAVRNVLQVVSV